MTPAVAGRRAGVFIRGLAYVSMTAANVALIAAGKVAPALAVSAIISVIWWGNAHRAGRDDDPWLRWCYGAGAGVGTLVGMMASRLVR